MPSKATRAKRPVKSAVDALGRDIEVPDPPLRIVSLVPSLTDLCFALGVGQRVVGISDVCTEPRGQLDGIKRIGGEKRPSLPAIRELQPDLVLANKEENRRQDIDRLSDSGIAVHVSHPMTIEDGASLCAQLGALVGRDQAGKALAREVRQGRARARREALAEAIDAVVLIWRDPFMTLSGETYGHDVLECLGARNPFASARQRYPKVTLEAVVAQAPALILLPDEPYAFTANDAEQVARAVPTAVVLTCPGRPFFWHGPRAREIPELVRDIAARYQGERLTRTGAGSRPDRLPP
ncbi:MAG TPA: helical backbone metal receptor [Polyangia bacterium]|nr:helical backbone metal receptor [Polyangia bacterium]